MVRILAFIIAVIAATPLLAGNVHCNQRVVSHAYSAPAYVAPAQTIIQNQTVLYSVASDIRQYAITPPAIATAQYGQLERKFQQLSDQLREAREQAAYAMPQPQVVYVVPQQVQQQPAQCADGKCPPTATPATPPAPQQPATPPAPERPTFSLKQGGVIEAKCIKCHRGANAKGGLDLTGSITCAQYHSAMQRLLTDDPDLRMPLKQPPLTPEETAAAMKELTAMVGK